jgi:hypothetical protein
MCMNKCIYASSVTHLSEWFSTLAWYFRIFGQLKSFENLLSSHPLHGGSEVIGFPAIFRWIYCSSFVDHASVENHSLRWVTDDAYIHLFIHIFNQLLSYSLFFQVELSFCSRWSCWYRCSTTSVDQKSNGGKRSNNPNENHSSRTPKWVLSLGMYIFTQGNNRLNVGRCRFDR